MDLAETIRQSVVASRNNMLKISKVKTI